MTRSAVVLVTLMAVAAMPHGQTKEYPPQGRLIDVGGRTLHIHCTGSGSPTVVLVAGGGAYAIDWALVQPRIAESSRVCSYDRAGLGWSDPGPADETVEQTVSDLNRLLQASGERGPVVLVGASIGGIYIRAYQRAYPADVCRAGVHEQRQSRRDGHQERRRSAVEDVRRGPPIGVSAA
jgi:pimeloyl-ACP methyl ester carboxylesterase